MNETRELLERVGERFAFPERAFEGFERRRDRKRRNQRITAGVVGLAVFAAAVWFVTTGGPFDRSLTPVGGGIVTGPTDREATIPQGAAGAGLIGLPPEGATPSTPTRGELVLSFLFTRGMGDYERFTAWVYADGRLIWTRLTEPSPGLVEQRLSPAGMELLRSEVLSTGLFDHDIHLASADGLHFGQIEVREGDRLVSVSWGQCCHPWAATETPTPEQADSIQQLDVLIEDPGSWLPAGAWEDQEMKPFIPARYSVCVRADHGVGLDRVLASLPKSAEDLLRPMPRSFEVVPQDVVGRDLDFWCSDVATEEARALAAIFEKAHLGHDYMGFEPTYKSYVLGATEVAIEFSSQLPDEVA